MFAQYQLSQLLASGDDLESSPRPSSPRSRGRAAPGRPRSGWRSGAADAHRVAARRRRAGRPGRAPAAAAGAAGAGASSGRAGGRACDGAAAGAAGAGRPCAERSASARGEPRPGVGGAGGGRLPRRAAGARSKPLEPDHARYLGCSAGAGPRLSRRPAARRRLLHERATLAAILDGAERCDHRGRCRAGRSPASTVPRRRLVGRGGSAR